MNNIFFFIWFFSILLVPKICYADFEYKPFYIYDTSSLEATIWELQEKLLHDPQNHTLNAQIANLQKKLQIKQELSRIQSQSIPIVPYNQVNFKLDPTRHYASDKNREWKRKYSKKISDYFNAKSTFVDSLKILEECNFSLKRSYIKYKNYLNDIQHLNNEIDETEVLLSQKRKQIIEQLENINIHVLIYAQACYGNNVKKGEALNQLEKKSMKEAIKILNVSIIDSYSYITNGMLNLDKINEILHCRVSKVPNTEGLYFDDYNFSKKKQMIYSVFHYEIKEQTYSKNECFKEITEEYSIEDIRSSIIDDRNQNAFVFPIEIAKRVNLLIRSTKQKNEFVQKQIKTIKKEHIEHIKAIKKELSNKKIQIEALRKEMIEYKDNVINSKLIALRNSCDHYFDCKKEKDRTYSIALSHGKSETDGFLYFVIYSERSITLKDSVDTITKQIIEDIYKEVEKSLNDAYLKQVTEIDKIILTQYSLEIMTVRKGRPIEAQVILRTQRRSKLKNHFGVGVQFKVQGHITFTDNEDLEANYISEEDCFNKCRQE